MPFISIELLITILAYPRVFLRILSGCEEPPVQNVIYEQSLSGVDSS